MRPPARIAAVALTPVLVLVLAACTQPAPLPQPTRTTATPTPSPTPGLPVPAIADLAVRAVGSGTVSSVQDESSGTVWDATVVLDDGRQQEVHLAAADGAVLAGPSADPTDADARSANRGRVAATAVSLTKAADAMVAAVPGGRVTAIELGEYGGRVVWRGDVTNRDSVRQDVRIDAVNGAVLLNLRDGASSGGGS